MRRNSMFLRTFGSVLLLMTCVMFFIAEVSAYQDSPWYKLYYTKATEKQAKAVIKILGSRAPEFNPTERYVIVNLTPREALAYTKKGFRLETLESYDLFHAWDPYARGERTIPGYSCYRQVAELFQSGQKIATDNPNLASWNDVGDSYLKSIGQGGYDIWVMVLTNKSVTLPKPALLITGGIHAREYVTAETAMRFAEYLVQNYGTNADVTWLLDYNEIHIMPEINPDGRTMADGTNAQIQWRKNKHMHDNNPCSNTAASHIGADLNRNFPYLWNTAGTSTNVCAETYPGKFAASEPETQAVRNYYLSIFDDYNTSPTSPASLDAKGIYIDLHSYGLLALWSWGHTSTVPPNSTGLQTLGRKFAFFNGHTPKQAIGLYATAGTTNDTVYAELGIPGYCFEMGTAFFQDCSSFENTIYPTNLQALLYAAKTCRAPYRLPYGPDALNVAQNGNVLTAGINDTQYNNSNGTETTHNITAAEYYIDHPDFDGGTPIAMAAVDGTFNHQKTENVKATIDCSGLGDGKQHTIFVRGKDASNNWGPYTAIFLSSTPDFDYNALGSATVQFTDKSKSVNGVKAWSWSFGDKPTPGTSTIQNPSYVYQKPYYRSYMVTLTVTDNNNNTCSITKQVQFKP